MVNNKNIINEKLSDDHIENELIRLIIEDEAQPPLFYSRKLLLNFFAERENNHDFTNERLEKVLELKARFRTEHSKLFDKVVNMIYSNIKCEIRKESISIKDNSIDQHLEDNISTSQHNHANIDLIITEKTNMKSLDCACDDVLSNISIVRYLIARNWNVDQALTMMKDCINQRLDNDIENILNNTSNSSILNKFFNYVCPYIQTVNKFGSFVYWVQAGAVKIPELFKVVSSEQLLNMHIYRKEQYTQNCFEQTYKLNKIIYQYDIVLDMSDLAFNLGNRALSLLKDVAKVDQNYYPERLGRLFIINAPWYFRALQALIKTQLTARTRSKCFVLGYDFPKILCEYIDEEQIPLTYGGKLEQQMPEIGSVKNAAQMNLLPANQEQNEPEQKSKYCESNSNTISLQTSTNTNYLENTVTYINEENNIDNKLSHKSDSKI